MTSNGIDICLPSELFLALLRRIAFAGIGLADLSGYLLTQEPGTPVCITAKISCVAYIVSN